MKDREFDDDEIDYLRSLPAVNSVGRNRIRYTDQFREYCMQRYRAGDSPTPMFISHLSRSVQLQIGRAHV